jgi:YesN/AraC family two-component response regulator
MKIRDSQLQVIWISRIDYSRNSGVKKHDHNFYQLLSIIDGEGDVFIDNKHYSINSDFCYLFKRNVPHEFYFTKESITIDIKFAANEDFVQYIEEIEAPNVYQVKNIAPIKELFKLSTKTENKNNRLFPFQVDVCFKGILLGILQEEILNYVNDSTMTSISETNECYPMVQFLIQHLNEKINLSDMSNHFAFNSHYIIELFNKNIGMPPMQYLQSLRIHKAKEHLEFTSYSVEEIADLVGLTSSYFSRLCCKRLGMSPSKLRDQMRTVIGKDVILKEDFMIDTQPSIEI